MATNQTNIRDICFKSKWEATFAVLEENGSRCVAVEKVLLLWLCCISKINTSNIVNINVAIWHYQLLLTLLSMSLLFMLKSYHNEPVLSMDSDRLSRVLLSIDLRNSHWECNYTLKLFSATSLIQIHFSSDISVYQGITEICCHNNHKTEKHSITDT